LIRARDLTGQRLQLCAAHAEPGRAVIPVRAHNSRTRDEAAPGAEVVTDPGEEVTQTELLAVARKDSFPQRPVAHYSVRFVEASYTLEGRAVDLSENNSPVDVSDAVVISAEHTIGVRAAESRLAAAVALCARHV